MSRDSGFMRADIDVRLLDDSKVRALVRSSKDEGLIARAVVAYLGTVLGSWAAGDRLTIEDGTPLWISDVDDLRERLQAVGLLDAEGRVAGSTWERWFAPALERRHKRTEAGRLGGIASGAARSEASPEQPSSNGPATPNPASTPAHQQGQQGQQASTATFPPFGSRHKVAHDGRTNEPAALREWNDAQERGSRP